MLMPERRHALDRSRRARGARASLSVVVAALLGALGPLYACDGANPVTAAGAGAGGSAGATGTGGGGRDAGSVDVAPNADDPPPFTGESYQRYCGDPGACDIMTGLCTNAGGGAGVAGAGGTGGSASSGGGAGGASTSGGASGGASTSGGVGGASTGGGGAGGANAGAGGASPGVAGGGGASSGEGASGSVGSGGGPTSGCKLAAIPDGGMQGPVDAGPNEDGGFYLTRRRRVRDRKSKSSDNAPCLTASDCGPGQGCVGHPPTATCHIYCCGDLDTCPTDTWCVPQRMAEDTSIKIPVCLPATECTLLDDSDTCGPGLTCTVVRSDGAKATTSCVEPGTNTENEPCPCAAGYQCSRLAGTCLKLCHVGQDNECDHDAQCQGGSNSYPPGIGTCVGGL